MIGKITRKSMRARWGRNVFIGLAIMLGVSFVAGSFVLADSMRKTFNNLFTELTEDVDLEVRSSLTVDNIEAVRDPVPASLADDIAAVEGVAIAGGTEILQAMEIRVAGESARFGVSEARWSLYPMAARPSGWSARSRTRWLPTCS